MGHGSVDCSKGFRSMDTAMLRVCGTCAVAKRTTSQRQGRGCARVTRRFGFGVELGVPIDKDRDPRGNVETWFRF